jgi:hypothetical protein
MKSSIYLLGYNALQYNRSLGRSGGTYALHLQGQNKPMRNQQGAGSDQGRIFLLYASFRGLFLYSAGGGDIFPRNVD